MQSLMVRNGPTMHFFIGLLLVMFSKGIRGQSVTVDCGSGSNLWPEGKDNSASACAACVVTPTNAAFSIDDMNTFTVEPDPTIEGTYNIYFASGVKTDFETTSSYSTIAHGSLDGYQDGTFNLIVIITDVNDNGPIYQSSTLTENIDENIVEDAVVVLQVTDNDGTDDFNAQSIVYSFGNSQEDYDGTFTLSQAYVDESKMSTVSINVVLPLDYEQLISYSLQIIAQDNSGQDGCNSAVATVVINVNDVEDSPPYFTVVASSTSIQEDAEVGSSVLDVEATDGDKGINNPVEYSIVSGNDDGSFGIDQNSGLVTVKTALDRDLSSSAGLYTITIMATETTSESASATTVCTISVTDVDDSSPLFSQSSYTASVPENSPNNFLVSFDSNVFLTVTDADMGDNAKFTVSVTDPNSLFDITPKDGQSQTMFSIVVSNSAGLDYETIQSTAITVTATDTNNPALTSTASIAITITDQNDNAPVIESVDCNDIPEDVAVGTVVCTVSASDADLSSPSNSIKYDASFGQLQGSLAINADTGDVTVLKNDGSDFNFELTSYYIITIMARDNDGTGQMDSWSVTINITDVNDNPPQFQQASYQASLTENEDDFYVPFTVQATDADTVAANGVISFKVLDDGSAYFDIIAEDPVDNVYGATIVPISPLDFEVVCAGTQTSCPITFTVQVSDDSNSELTDTAQVTVTLMDTNDVAPEFDTAGTYTATISETAEEGTLVTTVTATDGDVTTKYNTITYRLENDMAPNFAIADPTSGAITVANGADLDPDSFGTGNQKYIYYLIVIADDGGSRETASEHYVNVTIQDVNNKSPAFTDNGNYQTEVMENATDALYEVEATDLDSDSDLVYSIDTGATTIYDQNGSPTDDYLIDDYLEFADPHSGVITITKALDREIMRSIDLGLMVVDQNTVDGVGSALGTLTVTIADVNDNDPIFSTTEYFGTVMEATSKAVVTMQDDVSVLATDADTDASNKAITYTLVSKDPADADITIDAHTGYLITGDTGLDYETAKTVIVTIKAADGGSPPRESPTLATATINVTNKDEFTPVFEQTSYTFNADENSLDFNEVAQVRASDDDAGEDGEIGYELQDDYNAFAIDNDGVITLYNSLDYENTQTYILTVYAVDHPDDDRTTHLSGNAQVTVNVNSLNDDSPEISNLPATISISEARFEDVSQQSIFTVSASDDDIGDLDSKLVFSLNNSEGVFEIDPDSGDISVNGSLLNNPASYTLQVMVCDSGTNPHALCTPGTLSVNVDDANNNAPVVTAPADKTDTLPEYDPDNPDATPNDRDVTLFTITFTDADTTYQYQLTDYEMTTVCSGAGDDSQQDMFQLQADDGDPFPNLNLFYHGTINREDCSQYQFIVTLTNQEPSYDGGILTTSETFTLTITDVDAFPPQFPETEFNGTLMENDVGVELLLPQPYDADIVVGDTPELIWCEITSILPASDSITVTSDGTDCWLVTETDLDHESESHYEITVHTYENRTEGIIPPDTSYSQLVVDVEVGDVNDNPPSFPNDIYYSGVSSDTAMNTVILTLVAVDPDTVVDANSLTYEMGEGQVTVHDDSGTMTGVPDNCLILFSTGVVETNYNFLDTMQGYLQFTAIVYDSSVGSEDQHTGTTTVTVNVVSQTQKLLCSSMIPPGDFPSMSDQFATDFSAVLNENEVAGSLKDDSQRYIVVYDTVTEHVDGDVTIAQESDIYLHVLDDNSVMEAKDAMEVINGHSEELYTTVFQKYQIFYIGSVIPYSEDDGFGVEFYILIAVAGLLLITCIVILGVCIYRNSKIARKLRAIQTTSFGSKSSDLNRMDMPIHTGFEGSNPVYNVNIEVDDHQYDDTSDHSSASLEDVKNAQDFSGGLNNPNFEQRIENIFADESPPSFSRYDDDSFDEKFSLPEKGEAESGFGMEPTTPIESAGDMAVPSDNGPFHEPSPDFDDDGPPNTGYNFTMPEEADFSSGFEPAFESVKENEKIFLDDFDFLNREY